MQELHKGNRVIGNSLYARLGLIYDQMVAEDGKRMEGEANAAVRAANAGERPTRARPPAYAKLMDVLNRAHDQAAFGKGLDRHVSKESQPFHEQPICSLQRLFSNDYAFGQAAKKMEESKRLPKDKALAELLGSINYIAAAYIVREEQDDTGPGND